MANIYTYWLLSEGFANTLACFNRHYWYVKLALYCMDLAQYTVSRMAGQNIFKYKSICMKYIHSFGLDNEIYSNCILKAESVR